MSDYIRAFNRFELKYLLDYRQVRQFLDGIGNHVRHDAHAGRDGFYKVVSTYYDSPELKCYWEKVNGEDFRRKIRIRSYGERPTQGFVEIKQRYNLNVQKRRCRADLELIETNMQKMKDGSFVGGGDPVFDEVFNLRRRYRLAPRLLVSYNRAALFDRFKKDLRITVDRNVRCRNVNLSSREHRTRGTWMLPPHLMILEIKFNDSIPRWLCSYLNRLNLVRERYSKYASGIEHLGMHERPTHAGIW